MDANKLNILSLTEYNLIANKNPQGSYDRTTRENLNSIIRKLRSNFNLLSPLENRLYGKFQSAQFQALEDKDKKVKREVVRYRLSNRVKQWIQGTVLAALSISLVGILIYQLVLGESGRQEVDLAWYAQLNKMGFVSKEELARIEKDLNVTTTQLKKTQEENQELASTVDQMILNNKVTENLKYILKQIYGDSRTRYKKISGGVALQFASKELARYDSDPEKWYLLGIVETGVIQIFYNNDKILEIEAIFGRKGEETPLGEYRVKNKVYRPTWYKKEEKNGRVRVRKIPFGHPEHEIGHWWLGLKRLGPPVPGSYGIHGVNGTRFNEFFKKNFDWRNGSAGCPNIQEWFLEFLGRVVPVGASVNIVPHEKWTRRGEETGQLVGSL